MKTTHSVSLVLLFLGACQTSNTTPPRATSPDEALLLEVSATERAHISAARESFSRAQDASAAASADYRKMRTEQTSAEQARLAASVKVGNAETALTQAGKTGTTDDVATAKQNLANAKAELLLQESTVALRSKQADSANALAEVAAQHVKVEEAKVELAKVVAVNTLARPTSQKPDVRKFEETVRRAEADESVARARAESAHKEVVIATKTQKEREN